MPYVDKEKKKAQRQKRREARGKTLGMSHQAATRLLRKKLLFKILKQEGLNICFRCEKPINSIGEVSIEHSVPWENCPDGKEIFFDVDKVFFSHIKCNIPGL